MAFDYQEALTRISTKASLLQEKYATLKREKLQVEAEVDRLRQEMSGKDKELEELRRELEYMRIATTIAPSREDVEKARGMISNLVRNIDRCIADLTD